MENNKNDDEKQKKDTLKSIADILKVDGIEALDDKESENELAILEARKKQIEEYRIKIKEFNEIQSKDEYMDKILKELVNKGLSMLNLLEKEIEDCPRGRDVEVAASLITSINGLVEKMSNIKLNNERLTLDKEKFEMKKLSSSGNGNPKLENNGIIFVGSNSELLDTLIQKNIIPKSTDHLKTIDIEHEKEE